MPKHPLDYGVVLPVYRSTGQLPTGSNTRDGALALIFDSSEGRYLAVYSSMDQTWHELTISTPPP